MTSLFHVAEFTWLIGSWNNVIFHLKKSPSKPITYTWSKHCQVYCASVSLYAIPPSILEKMLENAGKQWKKDWLLNCILNWLMWKMKLNPPFHFGSKHNLDVWLDPFSFIFYLVNFTYSISKCAWKSFHRQFHDYYYLNIFVQVSFSLNILVTTYQYSYWDNFQALCNLSKVISF